MFFSWVILNKDANSGWILDKTVKATFVSMPQLTQFVVFNFVFPASSHFLVSLPLSKLCLHDPSHWTQPVWLEKRPPPLHAPLHNLPVSVKLLMGINWLYQPLQFSQSGVFDFGKTFVPYLQSHKVKVVTLKAKLNSAPFQTLRVSRLATFWTGVAKQLSQNTKI